MNYYTDHYGKDNVLVLPYELLKNSPFDFIKKFIFSLGAITHKNI